MQLWKLMFAVSLIAGYCPVYPFRTNKYFKFFLASSLIEPVYLILHYLFNISSGSYIPFALAIEFVFFPTKDTQTKIIILVSLIILILHPGANYLFELIISEVIVFLIIYFILIEILDTLKVQSAANLFLIFLLLNFARDACAVYFNYSNDVFLLKYYTLFLAPTIFLPLLIAYYGPNRKISFYLPVAAPANEVHEETRKQTYNTYPGLTPMERNVLLELSNGLKCTEIAEKMFVSRKAIYFHCGNLKSKLNLKTTNQLIKYGFEHQEKLKNPNSG